MSVEKRLPSGTYTWRIESYSKKMNETEAWSEEFDVACCKWRMLIYPNGDGTSNEPYLSVYLEVPDDPTLPDGWRRDVAFSFTLVNKHDLASITKKTRQTLEAGAPDEGFSEFISLTKLHDPAEGYLVNDAVVIKVDITLHKVVPRIDLEIQCGLYSETSTMSVENRLPSGSYTWRIENYSKKMNETAVYSEEFDVACCQWQMLIYPNGMSATSHCLSVYLEVPDGPTMPDEWCRDASVTFTLVNKHDSASITEETRWTLNSEEPGWGFPDFISLTELHDPAEGYLVNDALVIKVDITLHKIVPPVDLKTHVRRLHSWSSHLSDSFSAAGGSSHLTETRDSASGALSPSKADIKKAKQYLKKCLSGHFKLNMRDKLFSALSILCHSNSELPPDQRRSIETFRANFDSFLQDFLAHERENTNLLLHKIKMDKISSALKKNHGTNLSLRGSIDNLTKEGDILEKKLKEVNTKKRNLTYEWDTVINEAKELTSQHLILEKKLKEIKKSKKTVEETTSGSTSAWSTLKKHFL